MSPNDRFAEPDTDPNWGADDPELPDWLIPDEGNATEQRAQDYYDGSANLPAIREYDGNEWGDTDGIGGEWIDRDTDRDGPGVFDDDQEAIHLTAEQMDRDQITAGLQEPQSFDASSKAIRASDEMIDHLRNYGGNIEFDPNAGITKLEQAISDHEADQHMENTLNRPRTPDPDTMDRARQIAARKRDLGDEVNEALALRAALRKRGTEQKKMFMEDARDLWRMETLNLFQKSGYDTRADFLADPANEQEATRGNLAIHIFDMLCGYFDMDFVHEVTREGNTTLIELTRVGFRAFMILEKTLSDIHLNSTGAGGVYNQLEWRRFRAEVEDWLIRALTLSTRDLQSEIYEESGWITYFSGPITPGDLRFVYDAQHKPVRNRTVDEVIDLLGLSDLDDKDELTASIRGKAKDETDEA